MKQRRPARESRDSSQRPGAHSARGVTPSQPELGRAIDGDSADSSESAGSPAFDSDTDNDLRGDLRGDLHSDLHSEVHGAFDGDLGSEVDSDLDYEVDLEHSHPEGDFGAAPDNRGYDHQYAEDESDEDEHDPVLVRLNKYLASHGVASRRGCDQLIVDGGVMIDGEIVTDLGVKVDPSVQRIEVDGVVLKPDDVRHRYYLLNKPSGVVCTNSDRELRPRAIDLISDRDKGRLFTVGRLDEETTGLIILTNDGDFANRVMHPRYGVDKTYQVKVNGYVNDEDVNRIRNGVYLSEGVTSGARVIVLKRAVSHSKLLVTIQEGKNREVRRVFARFGYKVADLKRIRIGHLNDRGIKAGSWRPLRRSEIAELLAGPTADAPPRRAVRRGVGRGNHRQGAGRGRSDFRPDRRGSGDRRTKSGAGRGASPATSQHSERGAVRPNEKSHHGGGRSDAQRDGGRSDFRREMAGGTDARRGSAHRADLARGDAERNGGRGGARRIDTGRGEARHSASHTGGSRQNDARHGDTRSSSRNSASSHGDSRHSASRHGDNRYGEPRHGDALHAGTRHGASRHGGTRHGDNRHSASRHGDTRHSASRHGDSGHSSSRHSSAVRSTNDRSNFGERGNNNRGSQRPGDRDFDRRGSSRHGADQRGDQRSDQRGDQRSGGRTSGRGQGAARSTQGGGERSRSRPNSGGRQRGGETFVTNTGRRVIS